MIELDDRDSVERRVVAFIRQFDHRFGVPPHVCTCGGPAPGCMSIAEAWEKFPALERV